MARAHEELRKLRAAFDEAEPAAPLKTEEAAFDEAETPLDEGEAAAGQPEPGSSSLKGAV